MSSNQNDLLDEPCADCAAPSSGPERPLASTGDFSVPWWKVSATEAVRALRQGLVTPRELLSCAEARISETDGAVNACPTLCFGRARAAAERMSATGHPPQPGPGYLYGLPIVVKDTQAVEGVRFCEGSPIFRDRVADASDALVLALERNGAIVVGKTNTPEFAAGSQTYNPVFGTTANPWDLRATCGGSSGGSAAALACGQAWMATGSDLGGSCRIPASFCGVVGMRPSPFLVPKASAAPGQMPDPDGMRLFSVNGPLARNVPDLALLLDAMTSSEVGGGEGQGDGTGFLAAVEEALKEGVLTTSPDPDAAPAVGFSRSLGGEVPMDPEVVAICRSAASLLADVSGMRLEEGEAVDGWLSSRMAGAEGTFQVLRAHQFASAMGELASRHSGLVKPEILWNIAKGLEQGPQAVRDAVAAQGALEAAFDELFQRVVLLCLPAVMVPPFSTQVLWLRHVEVTEGGPCRFDNYVQWLAATSLITLSNCPAVSVPCGFTASGLPVGLQIVGPRGGDKNLLKFAALLEKNLPFASMVPIDPRRGSSQELVKCS